MFFAAMTVVAQNAYRDSLMLEAKALAKADSMAAVDKRSIVITDTAGQKTGKTKRNWAKWTPSTKKALLYSIIPGGGQIYNRKFWKLPIIYGGFVGCVYAWSWNGQMYSDYRQAYADITDGDPETHSYDKFIHIGEEITPENIGHYTEVFKSRMDTYRRWRDLSIFVTIGVYALSIIDAYVDASLSSFDISEDLSMKIRPAFINTSHRNMAARTNILENTAVGVSCSLDF